MRMIRSFGLAPDSSHQFGRQLPTPDNIRILDERVSPNHIILDMCSETLLTTFGISIRRGLGQMFACPRTNEGNPKLTLQGPEGKKGLRRGRKRYHQRCRYHWHLPPNVSKSWSFTVPCVHHASDRVCTRRGPNQHSMICHLGISSMASHVATAVINDY